MAALLQRWSPRPAAPLRLVCLPCAGGSAMFYQRWARRLPGQVELIAAELPGHGRLHREQPVTTMAGLVDRLLAELAPLKGPLAVYGHSMGALVGLELARAIRRRDGCGPAALLVSSSDSPAAGTDGWREVPDEGWEDVVRRLGGADAATLADPHLMELLVSALKSDLVLLDGYAYQADRPLDCPVRVYAGTSDDSVTPAGLAAWRAENPRDFELARLPGGHFFIRESEQMFLARLSHDLSAIRITANGAAR